MPSRIFRRVLRLSALAAFGLCGCAISPVVHRTSSFATVATAATAENENAYQLVERSFRQAETARVVAHYDQRGFDPSRIQSFLSPHDLEVRTDVIEGLRAYFKLLDAVSADKPLTDVDASAKSLGASLTALSANNLVSAKFTSGEATFAAAAIRTLGRALIEEKRRRELPAILQQMRQPIELICSLLEQDIGDPERSGLRNELHLNYLDLLREQKSYIADNEPRLSPSDRRSAIQLLPNLAASELAADSALATTQKALAQLARTHSTLAVTATVKDSAAFQLQLSELSAIAQQLHSAYAAAPLSTH